MATGAMTDTYFPGVRVVERPFQPGVASAMPVTAFGAFVGLSDQGPTSPTEVRSWPEFTQIYGTRYTDLHNAVYDFFSNGGRRAYIVRLPGTGGAQAALLVGDTAAVAAPTAGNEVINVTATNPGTWGNQLRFATYIRDATNFRFDAALYNMPSGVTFDPTKRNNEYVVDQWNDVSLYNDDPRYFYTLANMPSSTGSKLVSFGGKTYDRTLPDTGVNRPLPGQYTGANTMTGGVNGTAYAVGAPTAAAYAAGVAAMAVIPGPYVLNLPNVSTAAIITAALTDAASRGDVFVVCDCPLNTDVAGMVTYVGTLGLNVFQSNIPSFGAVYYPQCYMPAIGSTVPGRTQLRPAGGAIVGTYMATDDQTGPWRVPAGRNYRLGGALQTERGLVEADLTTLNSNNINALRIMTGTGVSIMGGRTFKKSGSDMYINVRRTIMEVTRSLVSATEVSIFENNDERLWAQMEAVCERYLGNIFSQGGLKGGSPEQAFYVRCDDTNNDANTIAQGLVNIEVGIALLTPAEFIVITIGQFEGGSTTVQTR